MRVHVTCLMLLSLAVEGVWTCNLIGLYSCFLHLPIEASKVINGQTFNCVDLKQQVDVCAVIVTECVTPGLQTSVQTISGAMEMILNSCNTPSSCNPIGVSRCVNELVDIASILQEEERDCDAIHEKWKLCESLSNECSNMTDLLAVEITRVSIRTLCGQPPTECVDQTSVLHSGYYTCLLPLFGFTGIRNIGSDSNFTYICSTIHQMAVVTECYEAVEGSCTPEEREALNVLLEPYSISFDIMHKACSQDCANINDVANEGLKCLEDLLTRPEVGFKLSVSDRALCGVDNVAAERFQGCSERAWAGCPAAMGLADVIGVSSRAAADPMYTPDIVNVILGRCHLQPLHVTHSSSNGLHNYDAHLAVFWTFLPIFFHQVRCVCSSIV